MCVPIQGACDRAVSEFFVNGQQTLWPWPGTSTQYNVTINQNPRTYSFCFTNVSSDISLSEYCYQDHSMGCSLCSADSGQIYFLSQTIISLSEKGESLIIMYWLYNININIIFKQKMNIQLLLYHHHLP